MANHSATRLALAALMLGLAGAAQAADVQRALPHLAARTTDLGNNTTALTYWVGMPDGVHVVTTIDTISDGASGADRHTVVRFAALIAPGQSQVISVPGPADAAPQELHIRRLGDSIEVARITPAQPAAEREVVTN